LNESANQPLTSTNMPTKGHLEHAASLVICTRNRPDLLRLCLQNICSLDPAPFEVIVVDNTAGDPATELLSREFGAQYIVESNPGLSRARNRGMEASKGDIVAYLDDDAIPHPDWLGLVLEPFTEADVASVTGDTHLPGCVPAADELPPTRSLSNKDPEWFEIATYGGLGYGTNMALRKSACTGWSGFDARLGRGAPLWIAEESHAFASLLARGYRAVHVPAAIVVHPAKPRDLLHEATSSFAYWLLLFREFPAHRADLIRFLIKRLRRKNLNWPRNPREPGDIIRSGWRVYLKAGISGTLLYLRNRKRPENSK
jgi:glycosyltransferase involved in cell wall biosynthesis